jgi:hypothetical protein
LFTLKTAHALALSSLLVAGPAFAGVANVPDVTGQTPGYEVDRDLGVTISGENEVYMLGTMTFDDVTNLDGAYNEANLGLGTDFNTGFGNGFGGNSIVIASDGTEATATSTFESGVPTTLLIKYDQTTGDTSLWVNPDLGTTEAMNTPEATANVEAVNGAEFDSVIFRGGDFTGAPATTDFTDFSVYHDGDTPFVPEPASLSLMGLGGLMLLPRRRRKA